MTYPPPQQGPGWAPGQGAPQPYAGQQPYPPMQPPQYGSLPQPQQGGQQQGWGQPPQQGWPQPPQQNPWWKSPLVLVGGAVVVIGALVVGVIAVSSGGNGDAGTVAASPSAVQEAPAATTSAKSTSKAAPTTTKAATQPVSADAKLVLEALPAPLREVVAVNTITEKAPIGNDQFAVRVVFTVPAKNSLTVGLLRTAVDIDRYPIAWIDTNPDKLLRQWSSQHPEWLIDKGEKKIRIDDTIPGGGATVETFNTATKLYTVMSGFKDKDSALKYLERAGF
ncbi:hypothetical protein [Nocardia alba]|uniref:Uncharacterized protein n=1 Tax=Nocardia alba TaxID=225051 RepID=A0A4R1FT58_9NOCA|nr:hypothetical protein [Nocardia alba]TCJ94391.1 hypothetical protein DFR71_4990 [Nocardia alba]